MIAVANLIRYEQKHIDFLESAYLPHIATISLMQDDVYCEPEVSLGDYVQEGQVIAKNSAKNAYIHSSIPGKIIAFQKESMPNGKKEKAVLIQLEGAFTYLGKTRLNTQWLVIPTSQRIKSLYKASVLNTFDAPQMLASQIEKLQNKKTNTLALRLFNADPSIASDLFISQQYTEEILEGASLLADSINAKSVFVLYADANFIAPNDILIKKLFRHIDVYFIPVKTQYYPQGTLHDISENVEHYMTKELKKNTVKISLAIDAIAAFDTYRAIVQNIPLIERIIHVSGNAFARDTILKVKIGTPIQTILEEVGGFIQKPAKIIVNGLIKGRAISNIQSPIMSDTKSITVLSTKNFPDQTQSPCIRCGRCHQICPVLIQPEKIFQHRILHFPLSDDAIKSSKLCTECALCNMVCPSRLPLYQTISLLKEEL
jgi:electron transport complex protein RnfC